ncbi:hypothetical protein [Paraburkholderia sp. SIMBA_053]|uniref:hypothetical protein n=1 Tax=Paraburkholderia sp. SIMBA_053 TaxID=3085794 RepID=UPI00397A6FD7
MRKMREGADGTARLTWDVRAPALFESAWNILIKIQLLNAVGFEEIQRIGGISLGEADPHRLFHSPADWDVPHIASFLHVDPARFRTAFLGSLGFPRREGAKYAVRHCPDCSALNYHCTLFNLPLISRCPWHGKDLTHGCARCGWLPMRWKWRANAELLKWRCGHCGHSIDLGVNLRVKRILAEKEDAISTHCQRMVEWWRKVRKATGDAPSLLNALACESQPFNYQWMWRLNWATGVCAPPADWGVVPPALSGGVLVRLPGEGLPQCNSRECLEAHRLVRKSIFRRFISGHAECFSELMAMGPFERISLDCSAICTLCVAFLSWRAAHERRLPSSERQADQMPSPPLRGVTLSGISSNGQYDAMLGFLNFVRIWAQIEEQSSVSAFRIIASRGESEPMLIPHVVVNGAREQVVCVIPRAADLFEIATKRCTKRRSGDVPMAHPVGWNTVIDEKVLFAARHHQPHYRNSYHHIYV